MTSPHEPARTKSYHPLTQPDPERITMTKLAELITTHQVDVDPHLDREFTIPVFTVDAYRKAHADA